MKTEFDLSRKMMRYIDIDDGTDIHYIKTEDVKEFIKRQIERIDFRIEELSEFDGLGEVMLQKAELKKVRNDLLKDAGEKLKGDKK